MYDDGYLEVTNNDYSAACISNMIGRNEYRRPTLKFDIMDIRKMSYSDNKFDLIIDKSTIDSLSAGDSAH